jgi:hypothetical protein
VDEEESTGAYVYFNDDVGFQSQGDVNGFPLVMHSEEFGGISKGYSTWQKNHALMGM